MDIDVDMLVCVCGCLYGCVGVSVSVCDIECVFEGEVRQKSVSE